MTENKQLLIKILNELKADFQPAQWLLVFIEKNVLTDLQVFEFIDIFTVYVSKIKENHLKLKFEKSLELLNYIAKRELDSKQNDLKQIESIQNRLDNL